MPCTEEVGRADFAGEAVDSAYIVLSLATERFVDAEDVANRECEFSDPLDPTVSCFLAMVDEARAHDEYMVARQNFDQIRNHAQAATVEVSECFKKCMNMSED